MSEFRPTHLIGEGGPECHYVSTNHNTGHAMVELATGWCATVDGRSLVPLSPPLPPVEPRWIELRETAAPGGTHWRVGKEQSAYDTGRTMRVLDDRTIPTVEDFAEMGLYVESMLLGASGAFGYRFKDFKTADVTNTRSILDEARIAAAHYIRAYEPDKWREWCERSGKAGA